MPTIISHAVIPLATAYVAGRCTVSARLLAAGVIAAMLPDADVISFHFGVAYGDILGHRGFTHSLGFAALLGAIAALNAGVLRARPHVAFLFIACTAASHGLLDMLTNGGSGVALFWPLTEARFAFPWRPIEVSPIGISRFFSEHGAAVLLSELIWVWLPCFAAALSLRAIIRRFVRDRAAPPP